MDLRKVNGGDTPIAILHGMKAEAGEQYSRQQDMNVFFVISGVGSAPLLSHPLLWRGLNVQRKIRGLAGKNARAIFSTRDLSRAL